MNLYDLATETHQTYDLKGDVNRTVNQLRSAGYPSEVSGSLVTSAVDFILKNRHETSPASAYAFLKGDAVGSPQMTCPIDGSNKMDTILLVQNRKALYCKACNVTLPLKAE